MTDATSPRTDATAPWCVDADAFPAAGTDAEKLRFLVRYAVLAPSGHNTQPWRFRLTKGEEGAAVDLLADRSRALPVVDPDDRALTISCGAALFHLRLAARRFGYAGDVQRLPDPAETDLLARFRLGEPNDLTPEEGALFAAIPERRTTRRPFEPDLIPTSTLDALAAAAEAEGAWLAVVTDPSQKTDVATLVAQGNRIQMADPAFREELAAWIHREGGGTGDGLTGYAFGVPKALDLATPAFAAVVRYVDMGEQQGDKDRALTEAAPALLVLGTAEESPLAWLRAGEALARVLLRARAEGVVAAFLNQPIEVEALRPRLRAVTDREGHPQILLRIGRGPGLIRRLGARPRPSSRRRRRIRRSGGPEPSGGTPMAQRIDIQPTSQHVEGSEVLRRLHADVNAHDAEAVAALCTQDVVWEDPAAPEPLRGREAVRQFHRDVMFDPAALDGSSVGLGLRSGWSSSGGASRWYRRRARARA